MHEPIKNHVAADDGIHCYICNHLIKDEPTYQGFMAYGVGVHEQCHAGVAEFERLRRNFTESDEFWFTGTDPSGAIPPEFEEALHWNEEVLAKAEAHIAKRGATIPTGVIHRLNHLRSPGPLADREFELVKMWSGVGAWTKNSARPHDFYGIKGMMQNLALLPPLKAYVKEWWLFESDNLNFSALAPKFHQLHSESGILLNRALKTALTSLLPDIPSVISIYVLLHNREMEKPEEDRQPIKLSDIVLSANNLERKRASVIGEYGYRRYSIPEVQDILTDSYCESVEQDSGLARGDSDLDAARGIYGKRAKRCKLCPNWYAVAPDEIEHDYTIDRCPGCTLTDKPELPLESSLKVEDVTTQSATTLQGALF